MEPTELSSALELAKQLVSEALPQINQYYRENLEVGHKDDLSYVTKLDQKIEKDWIKTIQEQFPHHTIIGEETGQHQAKSGNNQLKWYLDPLDGTTNFINEIPLFGSMISLKKGEKIVGAAVATLPQEDLYWAQQGKGFYKNDQKIKLPKESRTLEKATLHLEFRKTVYAKEKPRERIDRLIMSARSFRRYGSMVAPIITLAAGEMQACISFEPQPYDIYPLRIMFREAGYKVYTTDDNTNYFYHPQLADKIEALI